MFVEQRGDSDCAIACIAMATGRPYEEVLAIGLSTQSYVPGEGTHSKEDILYVLGYEDEDFDVLRRNPFSPPRLFRRLALGRRSIISVPSLNNLGGKHSVYYDGETVWDPNPVTVRRYTRFVDLRPNYLTIFRQSLVTKTAS